MLRCVPGLEPLAIARHRPAAARIESALSYGGTGAMFLNSSMVDCERARQLASCVRLRAWDPCEWSPMLYVSYNTHLFNHMHALLVI